MSTESRPDPHGRPLPGEVTVCPACGRSRRHRSARSRCSCIPEGFWDDPRLRALAQAGDLRGVLTALYGPPWYLSQRTLARLTGRGQTTIGRELRGLTCLTSLALIRQSLANLGAPRMWWDTAPPLPERSATDPPSPGTAPPPGGGAAPDPGQEGAAVVISAPVPVQVRTAGPAVGPAGTGPGPVAALVAAPGSLVVVVASGAAWTLDTGPGHTTLRIALDG
ncbi:hypothetical protein ACFVWN_16235 [Nocardiopsis flavescens]|uniref:hypothetical protein n=1 Tax=Nocardiopsis flavescens TaxID=758803 RepID=UPI00365D5FFD